MVAKTPNFFPGRVNMAVRNLQYAADVVHSGPLRVKWTDPAALDSAGIVAAMTMTSGAAKTATLAASTLAAEWGRGITMTFGAVANSRIGTVTGRDYLGQTIVETFAGSSAAAVSGVKAFKYIDSIVFPSTADTNPTVEVGFSDKLGLPYKAISGLVAEVKTGSAAANAGTLVAGLVGTAAGTGNHADVRGTYLPATVIPNGTVDFEIGYIPDRSNLHGSLPA